MEMLLRWGRAYWRWNERVWGLIRRAEMPLLALAGVAAAASWAIGVRTGNPVLLWVPALYGCAILAGTVLARR
jgi:hypothetical protein